MTTRKVYLVCYDIADPKRLRLVYRIMRGFGEHLQYSVFRCSLTAAEKTQMLSDLEDVIHQGEDQVMLAYLGPPDGRAARAIEVLGIPVPRAERYAIVV